MWCEGWRELRSATPELLCTCACLVSLVVCVGRRCVCWKIRRWGPCLTPHWTVANEQCMQGSGPTPTPRHNRQPTERRSTSRRRIMWPEARNSYTYTCTQAHIVKILQLIGSPRVTTESIDHEFVGDVWGNESASSPLVGFGWLNDNMIKGLTRLLSVGGKMSNLVGT
jgi:hypothetical protein